MTLQTTLRYSLIALILTLPACIPSKSESEKVEKPKEVAATPAPSPVPTPQKAPEAIPTEMKEGTSGISVSLGDLDKIPTAAEFDENEAIAVAKRIDEQAMSNGGVKIYTADDGDGYKVEGAHGLTATIKKDPSGEGWVFDGEFTAKAEGLKVGKEQITTVVEGVPYAGQENNTIQGLYIIVIPVQLPDINALETGDTYRVPVHFNINAKGNPMFSVNTMTTKNL